ncbi:hypothetical protein [Lactobacillus psittaci]|nr:hypothetical protein [Lactobacillus psittaci]
MKNKNILYVIIAAVVVVVGIIFFNLPHGNTSQVQTAKVASSTSEVSSKKASKHKSHKHKVEHFTSSHQHIANKSNSSNQDSNTGKYGNKGLYSIPSEYQGSWYCSIVINDGDVSSLAGHITLSDHQFNGHNVYVRDSNFDASPNSDAAQATASWLSGGKVSNTLNIDAWVDVSGTRANNYQVGTIDGNKVLFEYQGHSGNIVPYFTSKTLADKYSSDEAGQKLYDLAPKTW